MRVGPCKNRLGHSFLTLIPGHLIKINFNRVFTGSEIMALTRFNRPVAGVGLVVAEGVDDLLVREGLADQFVDLPGVFKVAWNYFCLKNLIKNQE